MVRKEKLRDESVPCPHKPTSNGWSGGSAPVRPVAYCGYCGAFRGIDAEWAGRIATKRGAFVETSALVRDVRESDSAGLPYVWETWESVP